MQALNALARVLELERRWRELGEVEARLDALEQRLAGPSSGATGRATVGRP